VDSWSLPQKQGMVGRALFHVADIHSRVGHLSCEMSPGDRQSACARCLIAANVYYVADFRVLQPGAWQIYDCRSFLFVYKSRWKSAAPAKHSVQHDLCLEGVSYEKQQIPASKRDVLMLVMHGSLHSHRGWRGCTVLGGFSNA